MLTYSILDTSYSRPEHKGMAATWLEWELRRRGIAPVDAGDADVILATVSSQQGIAQLRGGLRRAKNKRAAVVLGGGGCYAPAVFDKHITVACVGEGARFMDVLLADGLDAAMRLPEAWVPGETREVIPSDSFPWQMPPINHPDGAARVFGSRGCRYKCLFCQTGWEQPYVVNPSPIRLATQVRALERAGRKLAIVTNDGADVGVALSGQQEFLSVRLSNLKAMMPITRAVTKGVRIGVEGMSERLRVAVGKPVDNDELLSVTYDLLGAGVGVRWFFVVGLPGERAADYEELRYLVKGLGRLEKGCVAMNFHAFIPQPAAPLCVFPLRDEYWEPFDEFRRWFFHGAGATKHAHIGAPARYEGRLRRAEESMGAENWELRRGWWTHDNANWRVRYQATPEQMRRIARIYARKLGMDQSWGWYPSGEPVSSTNAAPHSSDADRSGA